MSRGRSVLMLTVLLVPTVSLQAAELVSFISCPVYRDTQVGRKSGCWLSDNPDSGIRYDITTSPTKPDWNFAVLVEGIVSDTDANPCGGVVLEPARVSVLPESCPRHMLPAENYPGRPFSLPKRNVRPLFDPPPVPPGPYTDKTFHIFFEFNKDFIIYQYGDFLLDETINWIRAADPKRVVITGYAATEPQMLSGRTISENSQVAKKRAQKLKEALLRLGVSADIIDVQWRDDPKPVDVEAADGLPNASLRRVDIHVQK